MMAIYYKSFSIMFNKFYRLLHTVKFYILFKLCKSIFRLGYPVSYF